MKGSYRTNQYSFHLRPALGLIGWLLLIAWPTLAYANGGTILLVEKVGTYELTVTASPYPLQVGANDVNVLVERLADEQLVLEAEVIMIAEPLDQPGTPQTFSATHASATNKLYYHANVVFPTLGRWKLTVHVDGPEGSVSTAFETQVEQRQFWNLLDYLNLVGLPLVVITILFFIVSRRTWKDLNNELEQEA